MRVNKIFGVKSITNLIYGMLLLLPMVSILSRVIYTQSNPNAKDSYSNNYIQSSTLYSNDSLDIEGENYVLTSYEGSSGNLLIKYTSISIDWITDLGASDQYNYDAFEMSQSYVYLYENLVRVQTLHFTNWKPIYFTNKSMSSNFTYKVYLLSYKQNNLDNVFEYSLNSFLNDYDNEGVDFFSWFTDLFLNQSNQHNALYLNFCNWYMNYVLLVSSAYLLFFALMWFINYIRKLLEKSSYQDFGGF